MPVRVAGVSVEVLVRQDLGARATFLAEHLGRLYDLSVDLILGVIDVVHAVPREQEFVQLMDGRLGRIASLPRTRIPSGLCAGTSRRLVHSSRTRLLVSPFTSVR